MKINNTSTSYLCQSRLHHLLPQTLLVDPLSSAPLAPRDCPCILDPDQPKSQYFAASPISDSFLSSLPLVRSLSPTLSSILQPHSPLRVSRTVSGKHLCLQDR